MKKLLITIDYRDISNKFWMDSSVKNKKFCFYPEEQTIHELIRSICSEEYVELTYKGKPRGNIYIDSIDGTSKTIGYMYRGISEIENKKAKFDVWVTIYEIIDFKIENV